MQKDTERDLIKQEGSNEKKRAESPGETEKERGKEETRKQKKEREKREEAQKEAEVERVKEGKAAANRALKNRTSTATDAANVKIDIHKSHSGKLQSLDLSIFID